MLSVFRCNIELRIIFLLKEVCPTPLGQTPCMKRTWRTCLRITFINNSSSPSPINRMDVRLGHSLPDPSSPVQLGLKSLQLLAVSLSGRNPPLPSVQQLITALNFPRKGIQEAPKKLINEGQGKGWWLTFVEAANRPLPHRQIVS